MLLKRPVTAIILILATIIFNEIAYVTGKARIPRSAIFSRDGRRMLIFKLHPGNSEVRMDLGEAHKL